MGRRLTPTVKPSRIRVLWVRGGEKLSFRSPLLAYVLGVRGAGKSAFLEAVAEHYLWSGGTVLDLFGARSGEGLAWLRSPWVTRLRLPALLVCSPHVTVESAWDAKPWTQVSLDDFNRYRVIVSASPLYTGVDEEFEAAGRLLDLLFQRRGWTRYIYIVVRESANLFYSRFKHSPNQLLAKAEAIYLLREARHHGLALGLDTQKFTAVDTEIRALLDLLVLKQQGALPVPRELWWIYRYIDPGWLRRAPPRYFALVTRRGSVGVGCFDLPTWHKRPREHLLKTLGINVLRHDSPPGDGGEAPDRQPG